MDNTVYRTKRLLFDMIYSRLHSLKRRTDEKCFRKYRKLGEHRCRTISNPSILMKELSDEILRVNGLSKKDFKISFGKRRVWNDKNIDDLKNHIRTIENQYNSMALHKPRL